ncbi:hypothetical protein [Bacillus paralicheniformis]|uniref:hypothetical protein n=6 Tax=Bacillus TaxID=1386 RepID=UPI002DBA6739|nr:hypothetical protein [Bacillus paralicheniformis]MEC1301334.1 hypothetical protein [Bacillus paralicheniformis]
MSKPTTHDNSVTPNVWKFVQGWMKGVLIMSTLLKIDELTLTEKNKLYINQKREIDRLNKVIEDLEKQLSVRNENDEQSLISTFLKKYSSKISEQQIEAKQLYQEYEKWIKSLLLGKRNFYNVVATYGYEFKRGKGNKLFVKGDSNASKTNL